MLLVCVSKWQSACKGCIVRVQYNDAAISIQPIGM